MCEAAAEPPQGLASEGLVGRYGKKRNEIAQLKLAKGNSTNYSS
jgi:hypothetical protein